MYRSDKDQLTNSGNDDTLIGIFLGCLYNLILFTCDLAQG